MSNMAVYRNDDKPQRFTLRMLREVDVDQLIVEAKELCEVE